MKYLPQRQGGQALIIVLLTMAVVLTVSLSAVSRSLTNMSESTYEEDALRAFSAAEAGIEAGLLNPEIDATPKKVEVGDDTSYTKSITEKPIGTSKTYEYPSYLRNGEVATLWLVSHDPDTGEITCTGGCYDKTKVTLYWGDKNTSDDPAIEVAYYYDDTKYAVSGDPSNVQIKNFILDHQGVSRTPGCSSITITPAGTSGGLEKAYKWKADLQNSAVTSSCSGQGCFLMVKVRMLYNSDEQPVAIKAPNATFFPSQGIQISSVGEAGDSKRNINVFQTYAETLDPFDSAVFSVGSISK